MKRVLLLTLSFGLLAGAAVAQDCCPDEKAAKAEKKMACCDSKSMSAEDAFMAEAAKMRAQADAKEHGGKDACCKSTEAKFVAKGDPGCCNAEGEPAKFKVFVAGKGYQYFGCEESAQKGRKELLAKHSRVGSVQRVLGKVLIH